MMGSGKLWEIKLNMPRSSMISDDYIIWDKVWTFGTRIVELKG